MRCDDLRRRLSAYTAAALSREEMEAADAHLDGCEECTRLVDEALADGATSPTAERELLRLAGLPAVSDAEAAAGSAQVLREVQRRRAASDPVSANGVLAAPGPLRLGSFRVALRGRLPYAVAGLAALVLVAWFAWDRQDRLSHTQQQLAASEARAGALQREGAALRNALESQKHAAGPADRALTEKVDALRAQNARLSKQLAGQPAAAPPSRDGIILRDGANTVMVGGAGLRVLREITVPAALSSAVRPLLTRGIAPAAKPVAAAVAVLRAGTEPSMIRGPGDPEKPVPTPLEPVLTAVRMPSPRLRWRGVPGAQNYTVRIANPEAVESGKVVWQGVADGETSITVPAGALQRGRPYFWQVETALEGETRLSAPAGFWVIDEKTARQLAAGERAGAGSPLLLAALYETHGLYGEARTALRRLNSSNPGSPQVRRMLEKLDRVAGARTPAARKP